MVHEHLGILILAATCLSITVNKAAPRYQRQFRRNDIMLLTYMIVINVIVSDPLYYLARLVTGNLVFEYVVTVASSVIWIAPYQVLFFASPLLHALKEKKSRTR